MSTISYDTLWKNIVSELFEEFLLFFAPALYEQVDFSIKPEFLEQELHQLFTESESGKRYTDKLAKVQLKNGKEQWILIHVEIQGDNDQTFAERMFRYFYRVVDKYNRKIYAISIFTDESKSFKPNQFQYEFFGTKLTYEYNTYKILEQDEQDLIKSENPFALVILAGLYVIHSKKQTEQKYAFKKKLVQLLLQKQWDKYQMNQLFIFIDSILQLPEKENSLFIQEIQPIIEKESDRMGLSIEDTSFAKFFKHEGKLEGRQEGKKEGLQVGRQEGKKEGLQVGRQEGMELSKRNIALKMIKAGADDSFISMVTELTLDEIEGLKKEGN